MKAIADFAGRELHWSQPSGLERAYDLKAGEELLATLRFRGGTLAEVETAEGRWTFKRQGFLRTQISARSHGSDSDVAVFRPHLTGGGEMVAGLGAGLEFAPANFWSTEWSWQDQDQALITYRGPRGLLKAKAEMEVAPEASRLANLGLVAVLGWYLILLFGRDMAIATASRSATVPTVMH